MSNVYIHYGFHIELFSPGVNTSFEGAVKELRNNLQFLVNKGAVGPAFIYRQEKIIESLINYQWAAEDCAQYYKQKLEEMKFRFEAVCLITGNPEDIYLLSGKSEKYLAELVKHSNYIRNILKQPNTKNK